MDVKRGRPHVGKSHSYVGRDPVVELPDGQKLHGEHGLMDIRAEVAREAYSAGMMDNPVIRQILKC